MTSTLQHAFEAAREPSGGWTRCIATAAGDGWDKVVAGPVRHRSGVAVKVVESRGGQERTRIVPGREWEAELGAIMTAASHFHVHTPGGD